MRVRAENRNQVATTINGRTYRARKGFFDMPPVAAAIHRKAGELPEPSILGVVANGTGYRCDSTDCGRRVFFTTCGTCGGTASREATT